MKEPIATKRLLICLGSLIVSVGCGTAPSFEASKSDESVDSTSVKPNANADQQPTLAKDNDKLKPGAQTTDALAGSSPEFLGEPLSHWCQSDRVTEAPDARRRTIEALAQAIATDTPSTIVTATDALAAFGAEAQPVAPLLIDRMSHPQPWVRVSAMECLEEMGGAAVGELCRALRSDSWLVQVRALMVLTAIGPEAKEASPLLEQLAKDKHPLVAQRAAETLAAIEPSADRDNSVASRASATTMASTSSTPTALSDGAKAHSTDWPEFHGPRRGSICTETGLLKHWPEEGPPLLWTIEGLGRGYSTVSIAGTTLYTMGDRLGPAGTDEEVQQVIAFDLPSRRELWATPIGPPHKDGPRCTPTIDGDRLYALGTEGNLVCLDAITGDIRWQKHLAADFGGRVMSIWKFSESPLVDGPRVVCTPGGSEALLVALDKRTGAVLWKCTAEQLGPQGGDGAGYSSVVVAEIDGVRQYVQFLGRGLIATKADTGKLLWSYNDIANNTANVTSPVVCGNRVFATAAYGSGSALVEVTLDNQDGQQDAPTFKVNEVYHVRANQFQNHHGGVVLLGDYIFGGHGQNRGNLVCLNFLTGETMWNQKALERGSAAVLYADGHLIVRYDRGLVALVEATPDQFRLKGSFTPVTGDGPAWAHPVIHDRRLLLRHGDVLACYDLRAGE